MSTFTKPSGNDASTPDNIPNPKTHDQIFDPKMWFAIIVALATFYVASSFLLPVFAALILSYALIPIVRMLTKLRLPRALASLVVVSAMVAGLAYTAILLVEPAFAWLERVPEMSGRFSEMLGDLREPVARVSEATAQLEEMTDDSEESGEFVVSVKEASISDIILSQTPLILGGCVSTIILLYFLLAFGDTLQQRFTDLSPNSKERRRVVETARQVESSVSRYLLTVTGINIGLGIVVAASLHFTGFQNPLLWGAIATLFNFIPYLGAIAGVALLTLASFVSFDSAGQALLYPAIYLFCTVIEGNFITPIILGRYFTINPIFIILALLLLGWLWGVLGAVLAVPMLVVAKALAEHGERTREIAYLLQGEKAKTTRPTR